MLRRPPGSTRTDTRLPFTTLVRSQRRLLVPVGLAGDQLQVAQRTLQAFRQQPQQSLVGPALFRRGSDADAEFGRSRSVLVGRRLRSRNGVLGRFRRQPDGEPQAFGARAPETGVQRSEEHTSELQSLMRISYAVFC